MKGLLINVKDKTVTEVEVNHYTDIYKHVGCDLFQPVDIDEKNSVYVDEEGLLKLTSDSKFFKIDGMYEPLCGNGLVLGNDYETGESVDTTVSIETLKSKLKFMDIFDVMS